MVTSPLFVLFRGDISPMGNKLSSWSCAIFVFSLASLGKHTKPIDLCSCSSRARCHEQNDVQLKLFNKFIVDDCCCSFPFSLDYFEKWIWISVFVGCSKTVSHNSRAWVKGMVSLCADYIAPVRCCCCCIAPFCCIGLAWADGDYSCKTNTVLIFKLNVKLATTGAEAIQYNRDVCSAQRRKEKQRTNISCRVNI